MNENKLIYDSFLKCSSKINTWLKKGIVSKDSLTGKEPYGIALLYFFEDSEECYKMLCNNGLSPINMECASSYIRLKVRLKLNNINIKCFRMNLIYQLGNLKNYSQ